jgi:hypothetical protein
MIKETKKVYYTVEDGKILSCPVKYPNDGDFDLSMLYLIVLHVSVTNRQANLEIFRNYWGGEAKNENH